MAATEPDEARMMTVTEPSPPGPAGEPEHAHKVAKLPAEPWLTRSKALLALGSVFVVLVLLAVLLFDARHEAARARSQAEAAAAAAATNEDVIHAVREQSERNGQLISDGVRCLRSNQQVVVANQRLPIGPERAELGNAFCQRFLEEVNGG